MLHVAIMAPPYLERVLAGAKRIEARLARDRRPPFGRVAPGDRLWLKRSGGPVVAEGRIARVAYFADLDAAALARLLDEHRDGLALEADWIAARPNARFATLIWLEDVRPLTPFRIAKRDRGGWSVLRDEGYLLNDAS
jgi:hypothetical protein